MLDWLFVMDYGLLKADCNINSLIVKSGKAANRPAACSGSSMRSSVYNMQIPCRNSANGV